MNLWSHGVAAAFRRHKVDLDKMDVGDNLPKPSNALVTAYVICFMRMELSRAFSFIYRCVVNQGGEP